MSNEDILSILKIDLQISNNSLDEYLNNLILAAREYIETEGITLDDASVGDGILVERYAAFLYRKRREDDVKMPRNLRWALNNRLMSEKGNADG